MTGRADNLARVVAAAGPDLAAHAGDLPPDRFPAGDPAGRGYVLEAVHEGYLLHYGEPRAFRGMDADLRLLAGDALYAQGLAHLADAADGAAVAELADLISLCAWAEAAGRRDVVERLWEASARLLLDGEGGGARAAAAADLAREGT